MDALQRDRIGVLNEQRWIVGNNNLLRIEIVPKNHPIYQQGRRLARMMYQKIWQTDKLMDDNDYGVVVFSGNDAIASVNVQLKSPHTLLKSEKFFHPLHWQNYLKIAPSQIAEISGLAIGDRVPSSLSRPVLMAMVIGLKMLLDALELKAFATIQHKFLIRVLTKSLKLPFFINSTMPGDNVPNDNYWKRNDPPRLYYLDGLNSEAIAACNSYWDFFEEANLKIFFYSRLIEAKLNSHQKIA